jgi:hypothetical protein
MGHKEVQRLANIGDVLLGTRQQCFLAHASEVARARIRRLALLNHNHSFCSYFRRAIADLYELHRTNLSTAVARMRTQNSYALFLSVILTTVADVRR